MELSSLQRILFSEFDERDLTYVDGCTEALRAVAGAAGVKEENEMLSDCTCVTLVAACAAEVLAQEVHEAHSLEQLVEAPVVASDVIMEAARYLEKRANRARSSATASMSPNSKKCQSKRAGMVRSCNDGTLFDEAIAEAKLQRTSNWKGCTRIGRSLTHCHGVVLVGMNLVTRVLGWTYGSALCVAEMSFDKPFLRCKGSVCGFIVYANCHMSGLQA